MASLFVTVGNNDLTNEKKTFWDTPFQTSVVYYREEYVVKTPLVDGVSR